MVGDIPRDTSEISLDKSGGRLEVISSLLKKVDVIVLLRDSYCHTSLRMLQKILRKRIS